MMEKEGVGGKEMKKELMKLRGISPSDERARRVIEWLCPAM